MDIPFENYTPMSAMSSDLWFTWAERLQPQSVSCLDKMKISFWPRILYWWPCLEKQESIFHLIMYDSFFQHAHGYSHGNLICISFISIRIARIAGDLHKRSQKKKRALEMKFCMKSCTVFTLVSGRDVLWYEEST